MNWSATIVTPDGTEIGQWKSEWLPIEGDLIRLHVGGEVAAYRVRSRAWNVTDGGLTIVVESLTPVRTQALK